VEYIFKIWPVTTEDGFTVCMGGVYRMKTDDIMHPVRYHTDPTEQLLNDINDFLKVRLDEDDDITKSYKAIKHELKKKAALTEGKMLRSGSNPPPPSGGYGNRPPPPPPPPQPRGRRIGGSDITVEQTETTWGSGNKDLPSHQPLGKYTTESTGPK